MKIKGIVLSMILSLTIFFLITPSGYADAYSYVYSSSSLNVRYGPSTAHKKLETIAPNTKLMKMSSSNGWTKIYYKGAMYYVASQYVSPSETSNIGNKYNYSASNKDNSAYVVYPNGNSSKNIEKLVAYGYKFIGCGYSQKDRYGPYTYDCSSYLNKLFKDTLGINIGSWTGEIKSKYDGTRYEVALSERKRGDILWGTTGKDNHVALYLGSNKILHCSGSRGVAITDMYYNSVLKWTDCYRLIK